MDNHDFNESEKKFKDFKQFEQFDDDVFETKQEIIQSDVPKEPTRGIPMDKKRKESRGVKKAPKPGAVKFADFLMAISYITLAVIVLTGFSFLLIIAYVIIAFIILVASLFLLVRKFGEAMKNIEGITNLIGKVFMYWPYIIGVGAATSLTALIIYSTNKNYLGKKSRIISSSIVLSLFVLALVFRLFIMKEGVPQ